ncbi:MAG: respiratory nitrate reductase subunit gamma [Propionibacteriaceae bacterium]|nr:respiratory nitrate reductase subunit gamma [Propionibacteriaceae bacterium]
MWFVTAFFGVFPYLALTIFVVGHVWRWKYDQFGWTTRTSELMEKRALMWGSPIFHLGMLFVLLGHALGLLIPQSWTTAIGVSENGYHIMAVSAGVFSGCLLVIGLVILLIRRFVTKARLRIVTRRADILMYILFGIVVVLGMTATFWQNVFTGPYNYRETISIWLRSLFYFQPNLTLMSSVPWIYQVHVICAMLLFAVWPFTRLVHLWSIPFGYFVRPAIIYHAPVR